MREAGGAIETAMTESRRTAMGIALVHVVGLGRTRPHDFADVALFDHLIDNRPSETAMDRGLRVRRVWFDDDVVELQIDVSDGRSSFSNRAYVGHGHLADTVTGLDAFRAHLHGGLLDVRFGEFGPEYASGAFHGRFHFSKPGRLFITCRQESEHEPFAGKTVASCATLYLQSEPVLLDRFVGELGGLVSRARDVAVLEAV